MIPEDGYQSSGSSMSSLVGVGSSDEWDDDDYDSDSSTDTILIQARAANGSDFNQSDLDDDYEGYSSYEWDASGDTEEAAALPLNQQLDEASEPQPLTGFNARTYAAVILDQALNDVEARIDATDALHRALRVDESRVARSADSCSGALKYHQDTDDPDDDMWCHREPTGRTLTSASELYQNCSQQQDPSTTSSPFREQGIHRNFIDLKAMNNQTDWWDS